MTKAMSATQSVAIQRLQSVQAIAFKCSFPRARTQIRGAPAYIQTTTR